MCPLLYTNTIREVGVTLILENDINRNEDKKCYLSGLSNIRKSKVISNSSSYNRISNVYKISSDYELSIFNSSDFVNSMNLALNDAGINIEDVDAVFSCACGHPGLDLQEYEAIREVFNDKVDIVAIQGVFGANLGGNFMLNCAAAIASFKYQCLPPTKGINGELKGINTEKKEHKLKTILVNGYNDLGNIISGVLQWI